MGTPQNENFDEAGKAEAARNEAAKNEAAKTAAGAPSSRPAADGGNDVESGKNPPSAGLPRVDSPRLDGEDPEAEEEASGTDGAFDPLVIRPERMAMDEAPRHEGGAPTPRAAPRSFRFALLAATIAAAAGIGSFVGAMTAPGHSQRAVAEIPTSRPADSREVLQALKTELAQLATLKTNLESATRSANSQFAKIAERLDTLEHTQADPAKLAHIAETLDRIEKHTSAPEITGSIGANPSAAATASAPKLNAPILSGWVVQDVHGGRAMVENRYGGLFLVGPGSSLPGIGRVEAVKRQDGEWVVVTTSGLITSAR